MSGHISLLGEIERLQNKLDQEREQFAQREFQLSGEIGELRFERDRLARAVDSILRLKEFPILKYHIGGRHKNCMTCEAREALAEINQILSAPAGEEKLKIKADPSVSLGEVHFKNDKGETVGKIIKRAPEPAQDQEEEK